MSKSGSKKNGRFRLRQHQTDRYRGRHFTRNQPDLKINYFFRIVEAFQPVRGSGRRGRGVPVNAVMAKTAAVLEHISDRFDIESELSNNDPVKGYLLVQGSS